MLLETVFNTSFSFKRNKKEWEKTIYLKELHKRI